MNPHRYHRIVMLIAVSILLILNTGFQPVSASSISSQPRVSGGDIPNGLSAADWDSIRGQIEKGEYNIHSDGQTVNRSMGWQITFGSRGPQVTPRDGANWTWGLTLTGYGYADKMKNLTGITPRMQINTSQLNYQWDGNLSEWWINSAGGLEQGFTIQKRPAGQQGKSSLQLEMAVNGTLLPVQQGQAIVFRDQSGASALTYAKLNVTDANGKVIPASMGLVSAGKEVRVRISVMDADAQYPLTIDPLAQQAYLKASNTGADDDFGNSVSVSGNTVVVGAYFEDSIATGINGDQSDNSALTAGAVYVFVYDAGVWSQQAYLKASNTDAGDRFGRSVSISGDTIAISAPNEDSNATGVGGNQDDDSVSNAGAVYVFTRSGTTWSQQAYIKASNPEAADSFGRSISLSGDTLAVGASSEDSSATGVGGNQSDNSAPNSGAVYVFTRSAGVWSQQAYIKASNTAADDSFGVSVALSGDTVLVGAYAEDSSATGINGNQADNSADSAGAAYIFTRTAGVWSQQAYLKASNTGAGDSYGNMVTLSGDTAVVGAYAEDSNATGVNGSESDNSLVSSGAAYVYVRSGTTWSQQAYIKASNTGDRDNFGDALSLSGDTLVVGAISEDSAATGVDGNQADDTATSAGAAYVYVRSGTTWSQLAYLKASNTNANDAFGYAVAVSGSMIFVSGHWEDSGATGVNGNQSDESAANSGAVYLFDYSYDYGDLPAPYATTLASDGARHMIVSGAPRLGSTAPDADTDGQPDASALGDDNTLVPDDEDGVAFAAGLGDPAGGWTNGAVSAGEGGAVSVTISTAQACLGAFFDFNSSGALSTVTLRDAAGAAISQPVSAGTYTFYFDVPAGTFTGSGGDVPVYSRFRVTSPVGGVCTGSTAFNSTGTAADGEVEDYRINFAPTALSLVGLKSTASTNWLLLAGCILLSSGGLIFWRRRQHMG